MGYFSDASGESHQSPLKKCSILWVVVFGGSMKSKSMKYCLQQALNYLEFFFVNMANYIYWYVTVFVY